MPASSPDGPDRVYLDHNATSPLRPEAHRAMVEALDPGVANPSSLHEEGRRARALLEQAREQVAAAAGVPSSSVVFTSGGSEAIEAAVRGVCDRAPPHVRRILVSPVEHSAVLQAVDAMKARRFQVEALPCDRNGRIDPESVRERIGLARTTALVATQWANNETGVIQPVEAVGTICREARVPFLVDAVQAAGKIVMDDRKLPADFLAVSAHKLGGPQGAGALTVREGLALAPLIHGGAQEMRRRGGTPGVAAIAGFGAAAAAALEQCRSEGPRLLRLRARIETRIQERFPDARFHGQAAPRLSNTVNVSLPGIPGDMLAIALDMAGFAVSTGSACASGAVEPSHVLQAMGCDEDEASGAIRISVGWNTTSQHVERFLEALPEIVERVRQGLRRGGLAGA